MEYKKAKAEVVQFDQFDFMMASQGTIDAITNAVAAMSGCDSWTFNERTGQITGCKAVGGYGKGDTMIINGVKFTWTMNGNSGHWNCNGWS